MPPTPVAFALSTVVCCTAFAQFEQPSNFRRTGHLSGAGSLSLEFERVFEQELDPDVLSLAAGPAAAGSAATNLELESTGVQARLAGSAVVEDIGIEAYLLIGAIDPDIDGTVSVMGTPTAFSADGEATISLGGGARFRLIDAGPFALHADGWGRWSQNDAELTVGGVAAGTATTRIISWELALYASWEFDLGGDLVVVPYGGGTISGVDVRLGGLFRTNQDEIVGVLGGVEVGIAHNVALFGEGRFLNQSSVIGGLAIGF